MCTIKKGTLLRVAHEISSSSQRVGCLSSNSRLVARMPAKCPRALVYKYNPY